MHVGLLANTAWLDEELAGFRYLVVGLIDEQIRVAQIVPEQLGEDESSAFGERISWRDSRRRLLRRWRLGRLAPVLEPMQINLLHALDGRLWEGALRLGRRLGCAVVLSATSHWDVTLTAQIARQIDPSQMAFCATTAPIADAIRQHLDPQVTVETIPPGVELPDEAHTAMATRGEQGSFCAVITGTGGYDDEYEALFAALPAIIAKHPEAQFFLDAMGCDQHHLWQAAERYGLLSNVSLIPRRLGHRELLLRANVLIHPQALGRSRSLTLGAMAHGLPVLARHDRWLDYLIDEQTAWVIQQRDPQQWTAALSRLFDDPPSARKLGERARKWTRENRLISRQIELTRALYRRATGESHKFPQPQ